MNIPIKGTKTLLLGFTFKENCPDVRNTRVIDIYHDLVEFGLDVIVYDPWVDSEDVKQEFGIEVLSEISENNQYSAVVLAVAHESFLGLSIRNLVSETGVIYDVKSVLPKHLIDARL